MGNYYSYSYDYEIEADNIQKRHKYLTVQLIDRTGYFENGKSKVRLKSCPKLKLNMFGKKRRR